MRRIVLAACVVALFSVSCGARHGTIGAILGQRDTGRLFIRDTPAGLSAREAGLAPGDEVLLVDGIDVRMLSPVALHGHLSGDVGTKVKLTLIRENAVIRVTLERRAPPPRLRGVSPTNGG